EARRPPRAGRAGRADAERGRPPPRRNPAHRRGATAAPSRPLPPHRLARAAAGPARRRGAVCDRGGRRPALAPVEGGRGPVTRTFSSLRYRNYRLFFVGQLISQTG